jgi:hypothetical protein
MTDFVPAIRAALGDRARLKRDAEGFPFAPARYGRLEWRGLEPDGRARVYAYTDRPRMIAKLRAVDGAHPTQIGDTEAACWMAADDVPAIKAVAALLRTRIRRAPETGRSAEALAEARPRRAIPLHGMHFQRRDGPPAAQAGCGHGRMAQDG